MSAAIFHSELSSITQESRKKFPDIRAAAELSLSDLKALRITSEAQLAGDLSRKPSFAEPFILACNSRSAKLITSGVICLQRLAASHALPSWRLKDVLDAFREVTSSTFDVQIKILQTLPPLLQTYASEVHGELLFTSLEICGILQGSKVGVLGSTASATLQQLISNAFERLTDEADAGDVEIVKEINLGNQRISLTQARTDASEILDDLCDAVDGAGAKHFKASTLSPVFILDLLSAIFIADHKILRDHQELLFICRERLMPYLIDCLSTKSPFPVTIRCLGICFILIRQHFDDLRDESEAVLDLLVRVIEADSSHGWKRAACAEVLRKLMSDFALLLHVFNTCDLQDGHKNVVRNMMAAYARIAAEKPTVIGSSHQSTLPARQDSELEDGEEQASLETSGMEGVIGSTVTAESHVVGISAAWSIPKAPFIEQLDKTDAPSLPDTYIYTLALDCMSALSEGLAKFIMPISLSRNPRKKPQLYLSEMPQDSSSKLHESADNRNVALPSAVDSRKVPQPVNPLKLKAHPQEQSIKTLAAIINACWPAFLATCTTFLNAALDTEFYHNLVRAMQKLAQVAGVMELTTPRDALLTALGKASVPPHALKTGPTMHTKIDEADSTSQSISTTASPTFNPSQASSVRASLSPLTARNLLCLRALLNLGIALGPTLNQEAWSILLETLQQAEHLISFSSHQALNQREKSSQTNSSPEPSGIRARLGGELAAVETAARKMFASTANYETVTFLGLLKALLSLSVSTESLLAHQNISTPLTGSTPRRTGRMHQSSRSISGTSSKGTAEDHELPFVLSKISEVARSNLRRFALESATDSGWTLITESLLSVMKSSGATPAVKIRSSTLVHSILLGALEALDGEEEILQERVQLWSFTILQSQVDQLYQLDTPSRVESRGVDQQIHEHVIETLRAIVERHGQNLFQNWATVFELIGSIFDETTSAAGNQEQQHIRQQHLRARGAKLLTTSFRLVQLVGSDFLGLLSVPYLLKFVDIILLFGRQGDDLNIALTSTTYFRNLADFLHTKTNQFSLDSISDFPTEESLVNQITDTDELTDTVAPLWLMILLRLGTLTADSRYEVRKSAMNVLLRIMDVSRSPFSSHGWHICLSLILLPLFKSHGSLLVTTTRLDPKADEKTIYEWHSSTVALVEGGLGLVARYVSEACGDKQLLLFWKQLFDSIDNILACSVGVVSCAIFQGIILLFASLKDADHLAGRLANPALKLWMQHHPADIMDQSNGKQMLDRHEASNQIAFSAHAELLIRIYDALPSVDLDHLGAKDVLQNFRQTILLCVHPAYESDVLKTAPEQEHVLSSLQLLSKTRASRTVEYVTTVLDFVQIGSKDEASLETESLAYLPTRQRGILHNGQIPSFVAFSSKCLDILERDIIRLIRQDVVAQTADFVSRTLDGLSTIVKAKYSEKAHRGEPLLWYKAMTSSLRIIEAMAARRDGLLSKCPPSAVESMLASSIEVAVGILGPGSLKPPKDPSERDVIMADEDRDMVAFEQLLSALIPTLARLEKLSATSQKDVESQLQRSFVDCLLRASLVAAPQFDDLPTEHDLICSPLSSINQLRPGTIKQPVYSIRERIPYLVVDTLFRMTAAYDSEMKANGVTYQDHETLAVNAAPYMLLRAAHTFKMFIADQPLQGPMPMPCRLRAEMIYILRLCLELRSENKAFTGTQQSSTLLGEDGKRHLRLLFPLILLVWKVWNRIPRYGMSWTAGEDGVQIERLLHQWMALCGENWMLATSIPDAGPASR